MPSDATFRLAVRNVASQGETDVFPRSFEGHVFHDREDRVIALLRELHDDFDAALANSPPTAEQALAPVGYTGFRWASLIEPVWNTYLLALALDVAPAIEKERREHVDSSAYSYRYSPDAETARIFTEDGWVKFRRASLESAEQYPFVIVTDIADFYPRIYHHRLKNSLSRLAPGSDIPNRVDRVLSELSDGYSFGLPVGGPAARLFAEAAITPVDRLLTTSGIHFRRFADDYHIFVAARDEAYGALTRISEVLRPEGLSLQKSKTQIMTSIELKRRLALDANIEGEPEAGGGEDQRTQFLRIALHFDPYSPTAAEDYERLKSDVARFDILGMLAAEIRKSQIHVALTRRLLRAIRFLDQESQFGAVLSLVDNLDTLAPVLPAVLITIAAAIHEFDTEQRSRIVTAVQERLASGDPLFRLHLNVAFALRVIVQHYSPQGEETIARVYKNAPSFVRRDIILLMAQWKASHWLSEQRGQYANFPISERRAFLLASYALGDEGRHWRDRLALSGFDQLVREWMGARVTAGNRTMPLGAN